MKNSEIEKTEIYISEIQKKYICRSYGMYIFRRNNNPIFLFLKTDNIICLDDIESFLYKEDLGAEV